MAIAPICLAEGDIELICIPEFVELTIDDQGPTAIKLPWSHGSWKETAITPNRPEALIRGRE